MLVGAGRFRRSDRLLDARDFRRVMRRGNRAASDEFVVLIAPRRASPSGGTSPECRRSELEPRFSSRLGITVSRKVGNAVTRNRIKRRVREWFRHEHACFPEGTDVVVIARRAAAASTYAESMRKLSSLREDSQGRSSA